MTAVVKCVQTRGVTSVQFKQIQDDLKVLRHEVLRSGEAGVQLPVNLKRLIWNAQQIFHCQSHRRGPSGALLLEQTHWHNLGMLCLQQRSSLKCHSTSCCRPCAASRGAGATLVRVHLLPKWAQQCQLTRCCHSLLLAVD